ncbi:MAG: HD domain-containing protein [Candidatus Dojkabacteria bacterium]|nr:HD domain-containing protein [Candidatus Dojkabacteria bacterium]MDQ7020707.1 HD domain-containing protein [Candidatus Dojkabacteria bacterium]
MNEINLSNLLFELSNLDRIPRTGLYQFLYEDFESVASHSYKVALISFLLAKELELNIEKVLVIALFHDIAEIRTGDSNWINKPYVNGDEEAALNDQLNNFPDSSRENIKTVLDDYKKKDSIESKIVKDADYIEYFMSLKLLDMKGNKEAEKRLDYETKDLKFMRTDIGKDLLKNILKTDPNEWTRNIHNNTMKVYKKKIN